PPTQAAPYTTLFRSNARAEERGRGVHDDDEADVQGQQHHERVQDVRNDVDGHDARVRASVDPGQGDEITSLHGQHFASDHAGEAGPDEHGDGDGDGLEPL